MDQNRQGPRGIAGWLTLPLLGLIVTPLRVAFEVAVALLPTWQTNALPKLIAPLSSVIHPLATPMSNAEVVGDVILIAFTLIVLWLFLARSRRVPALMVVWFAGAAGLQVLHYALAQQIDVGTLRIDLADPSDVAEAVITAAIWIPYFLYSRRVHNTFVN